MGTDHISLVFLNGLIFPIGQSGEASWWRVCYQHGLIRLVPIFVPFNITVEQAKDEKTAETLKKCILELGFIELAKKLKMVTKEEVMRKKRQSFARFQLQHMGGHIDLHALSPIGFRFWVLNENLTWTPLYDEHWINGINAGNHWMKLGTVKFFGYGENGWNDIVYRAEHDSTPLHPMVALDQSVIRSGWWLREDIERNRK